jgi:predicted acetyltransferase
VARLIVPDVRARESFLAAMAEFAAERRTGDRTMVGSDLERYGERWHTADGFAGYVADLLAEEHTPRWAGFVTQSTRWWVEGPDEAPEFIGRTSIRHRLTDALRTQGGHIGYDVRRSRRRQGHATALLRAALDCAHGRGIDPVLITCDATNVGSRRVIERNGGVPADPPGTDVLRFWVPTASGQPAPEPVPR